MNDDIKTEIFCHRGHPKCKYFDKENGVMKHCSNYINVAGRDPQTGEAVDDWRCADTWTPILLVQNAMLMQSVRQATESFRDEMIKSNQAIGQAVILSNPNNMRLVNGAQ